MNQKGRSCPTRSRLSTVEINTPDAAELAAFYADITGGQATFADRAWATFNDPGGRIDDLSATEARVLAAGATRYEFQPNTRPLHRASPTHRAPVLPVHLDDVPAR